MDKRPTIKDVARLAKVATGTVSRVMNGDLSVHPVIRDAVELAIKELNYRPSPIARNLRRGTSGILGVVLSDATNPTYSPMIPNFQELTRQAGYAMMVMDSAMDPELERKNLEILISLHVDGIILNPLIPIRDHVNATLGGVPAVLIPVAEWTGPRIAVNNSAAIFDALNDLITHGHKKIALLTIHGLGGTNRDRLAAMSEQLATAGAALVSDASWSFNSRDECSINLPTKLQSTERPTAIFVASALLPELLIASRNAKLTIPGDLSIVSIASSELASTYNPPINVISFDQGAYASEAVEKLLAVIQGTNQAIDANVHVTQYIRRASIGPRFEVVAANRVPHPRVVGGD